MERLIAIADLHGCYDLTKSLVESEIKFNPKSDTLVFLGDFIDRGSNSLKTVAYVSSLKAKYPDNIFLLKGNHEQMADNSIKSGKLYDKKLWEQNGGDKTINDFNNHNASLSILGAFIDTLGLYYETDSHIFVHGCIPSGKTASTADEDDMLWERDFNYNGAKKIVVGHTIQSEVKFYRNVIAVDTGAWKSGVLSAYDTLNNKVYSTRTKRIIY